MSYKTDFMAWAEEQADALRRRSVNELDWENLVEEIESLGINQKHEVTSRLMRICEHLLKLAYLSDPYSENNWKNTVIEQRFQLEDRITSSPSLRPYAISQLDKAYRRGCKQVSHPNLPTTCTWTIEQILDEDFWP